MLLFILATLITTPGEDPRLATPTHIDITMEPVAVAVAGLGKKAGCPLEVASALKNRKVAIHTEKEPLGETMDGLADAMDAKWTQTASGWRLDTIPERQSELASYQKLRRQLLIESNRKELERKATSASKMTLPEMQARRKQLEKELKEAKSEDARNGITKELYGPELLQMNDYAVGTLYGSLDDGERERFWNGEVFYATSAPLPGGRALPEGAGDWRDEVYEGGPEQERPKGDLRVFLRFHPVFQQLMFRTERDGESTRSLPGITPYTNDERESEHPFSKRQQAWAQEQGYMGSETKVFAARREEKTKPLPAAGKGPWFAGFWSVADVLARFHDRTGLPIVAVVSRKPWPYADPDYDGPRWEGMQQTEKRGTLGAAVHAVAESGGMLLRESDGYLLGRPFDGADRLAFDPPEDAMRAFEAVAKPTIDDYAVFATRLTEPQAYILGRPEEIVGRHPFFAFADGYTMLKFWGALSPQQRAFVRRGGSIPYDSLNGPLRSLFEQAVLNSIMEGANFGPSVKRVFDGPWDGSLFNGMALWGESQNVNAGGHGFQAPSVPGKFESGYDNEMRPGIRFTLGQKPGDGFVYTLDSPGGS